jgi:hypothetical protein
VLQTVAQAGAAVQCFTPNGQNSVDTFYKSRREIIMSACEEEREWSQLAGGRSTLVLGEGEAS